MRQMKGLREQAHEEDATSREVRAYRRRRFTGCAFCKPHQSENAKRYQFTHGAKDRAYKDHRRRARRALRP